MAILVLANALAGLLYLSHLEAAPWGDEAQLAELLGKNWLEVKAQTVSCDFSTGKFYEMQNSLGNGEAYFSLAGSLWLSPSAKQNIDNGDQPTCREIPAAVHVEEI